MSSVLGDPDTFAAHVRGFEAGSREGEADGVQKERARLRPLLKRCLYEIEAVGASSKGAYTALLADLRAELEP